MCLLERIQYKCSEYNISIKSLEDELGFGNGNIRRWNKNTPSIEKVHKVAQKLNVSIDWLVTGKNAANLTQNEQKLIELYQNTEDTGQKLILKHTEDIQKALPLNKKSEITSSKLL